MSKLDEYRKALDKTQDLYRRFWVLPYGTAYAMAHKSFKETLDEQKKLDAIQAEIFMMAVSLGIGGGLGALYGKTALKAVAFDKAVSVVCDRNMLKTFSLMHQVSSSPSGTFLVSTVWDKAAAQITTATKEKVTKLMNSVPKVVEVIKDPQVFQNSLEMYLLDYVIAAKDICDDLEKPGVDSAKRDEIATAMLKAPFVNKAPRTDATGSMPQAAKDMELGMYMPIIMASDRIRKAKGSASKSVGGMPGKYHEADISVPTSDSSYPEPYSKIKYTGFLAGISKYLASGIEYDYLFVDYHKPGSKIYSRIDKLHQDRFGGPFFVGSYGKDEVERAEKVNAAILKKYATTF